MARYGQAFKDREMARLLPPESASVEQVPRELGVGVATLEQALAVYLIVAWRIHHLTRAIRELPEAPCTEVFSGGEWQTTYLLQKRRKPPKEPPRLRQLIRMLAQLGGLLARKEDGEPGVETVWRGYMVLQQALHTLEIRDAVEGARKCV